MNISVRQLQVFVLGAQCRSFSEAAAQLGISQPGYSLLIRQLEENVGFRLFERSTRHVALTAEGAELLLSARRTLEQLSETCRLAEDVRLARRGVLRLAVVPSMAYGVLPAALRAFRAQHPDVRLELTEEKAIGFADLLRSGRVEVGLGLLLQPEDDLAFEPLMRDELVLLLHAEHPLAANAQVRWSSLQQHAYISLPPQSGARIQAERAAASAGAVLTPAREVDSLTTLLGLLHAGMGYAVLPRLMLGSLNLSELVTCPLVGPRAWRDVGLVHRRHAALSPSATGFMQAARTCIESAAPGRHRRKSLPDRSS